MFLFSSGVTQHLPCHSPSPGVQSRRAAERSGAGAWRGKAAGLRGRRGQSGHCRQPEEVGDLSVPSRCLRGGGHFSESLSNNSRLLGACQNFPECDTESALLAAAR